CILRGWALSVIGISLWVSNFVVGWKQLRRWLLASFKNGCSTSIIWRKISSSTKFYTDGRFAVKGFQDETYWMHRSTRENAPLVRRQRALRGRRPQLSAPRAALGVHEGSWFKKLRI
ncbi:hypothetical protein B0T20DRAFT_493211, partial [Sordaria brevicollis]